MGRHVGLRCQLPPIDGTPQGVGEPSLHPIEAGAEPREQLGIVGPELDDAVQHEARQGSLGAADRPGEGPQVAAQGLEARSGPLEGREERSDDPGSVAIEARLEQAPLVPPALVQARPAHPGGVAQIRHRGRGVAPGPEQLQRRVEHRVGLVAPGSAHLWPLFQNDRSRT